MLFGEVADTWRKQLYVSSKSLRGRPMQVIHTPSYSPSLLSDPPWCELSTHVLVCTAILSVPCFTHRGGKRPLKLWSRIYSPLIWFQLHILSHDTKVTYTTHHVQVFLLLTTYPKPVSDFSPMPQFSCVWWGQICVIEPTSRWAFFFSESVLCSSGWPQTH